MSSTAKYGTELSGLDGGFWLGEAVLVIWAAGPNLGSSERQTSRT